jgi:hypothetical protein
MPAIRQMLQCELNGSPEGSFLRERFTLPREAARRIRISSTDLNWKVIEHMREGGDFPLSIAVVADPKLGWRAIVGSPRGRSLRPESARRLATIEKRLQREYALSAVLTKGTRSGCARCADISAGRRSYREANLSLRLHEEGLEPIFEPRLRTHLSTQRGPTRQRGSSVCVRVNKPDWLQINDPVQPSDQPRSSEIYAGNVIVHHCHTHTPIDGSAPHL